MLLVRETASFQNEAGGKVTNANISVPTCGVGGGGDRTGGCGASGFLDEGTFAQDGGKVTSGAGDGPVYLLNGSSLDFGGTGPGSFALYDPIGGYSGSPTFHVSGDIASAQTLDLMVGDIVGLGIPAVLNAAGSFTNAGTFTIAPVPGGDPRGGGTVNLPSGSTLTNTGTMTVNSEAGNQETLTGNLVNAGSLSVTAFGGGYPGIDTRLVVTGNFTELSGSTTQVNVLGYTPTCCGTPLGGEPLISVQGTAQLGGTLDIMTDPKAGLSSGQLFNFLSSGTIQNQFDRVTGLFIAGDLLYDIGQTSSTSGSTTSTTITFTVSTQSGSPHVFAADPQAGPAGTTVTIFGSDLAGATGVSFGGKEAATFSVISDTQVTAQAPSGISPGSAAPITVTVGTTTTPRAVLRPSRMPPGHPEGPEAPSCTSR